MSLEPVGVQRNTRRLWLLVALGVFAILVVLLLLAISWRDTYQRAQTARSEVESLRSTVDSRNWTALPASFERAQTSIDSLADGTDGPAWQLLTHVPIIGRSASAASALATSLDEVMSAGGALVPYASQIADRRLRGDDGSLNLASLSSAAPDLRALGGALESSAKRMNEVDASGLPAQLAEPVREFRDLATSAYGPVQGASELATWGPSLLGAGKARDWLVLLQNPAEARGSGGFPGGFVTVKTKDGRIAVSQTGTSDDLARSRIPIDSAPADSRALWGKRLTAWNTFNGSPHFPLVARLAADGMKARGEPVSGVVAVDPRLVAAALKVIGPVTAAGTTLSAETAERFFTVDVYKKYAESRERDRVTMTIVQAVLARLLSEPIDPVALFDALRVPIEQGHLKVWSANPDEQAWLAESAAGGVLPDTPGSIVAVVTNNSAGSKMDAFMKTRIHYRRGTCDASTARSELEIQLQNDAPDGLPTATGTYDRYDDNAAPRGSTSTVVYVYPPVGSNFQSATLDGKNAPLYIGHERNRQVWYAYLPIDQHQKRVLKVNFGEPSVPSVEPRIISQSLVHDPIASVESIERCYS